jgi:hypothetical protein
MELNVPLKVIGIVHTSYAELEVTPIQAGLNRAERSRRHWPAARRRPAAARPNARCAAAPPTPAERPPHGAARTMSVGAAIPVRPSSAPVAGSVTAASPPAALTQPSE